MRSPRAIAAGVAVLLVIGVAAVLVSAVGAPRAAETVGTSSSVAAAQACASVSADAPGASASGLPIRPLCALPVEATQVWRLIQRGGPYGYPQDGTTFLNAERLLPIKQRGYYREFTVPTPSSRDRGARRLIAGQGQELYYTADHYGSFVVVDVAAGGA